MQYVKKLTVCLFVFFLFCALSVCTSALNADPDADGDPDVADARIALRIAVGLENASEDRIKNCDFDSDASITPADARQILRLAVNLGRSDDSGMPGAKKIGMTENYYGIYQKDAATYIDGILIANKTYALPSSYSADGLDSECSDAFYKMQADAEAQGIYLYLNSGYRPYSEQEYEYETYIRDYGCSEAQKYVARPGHSEHQTGLAIDVTNSSGYFTGSVQADWLHANCANYGFILRYPEGKSDKTGYNPEAWHIRYVGTQKAKMITDSGLCLEEYYGITSAYPS